MATLASKQHLRQGFVVVNGAGHPEEFLHRVHHFGRFCSQQFAIQDKDLETRKGEKAIWTCFHPSSKLSMPIAAGMAWLQIQGPEHPEFTPTHDVLYQRYPCSIPAHCQLSSSSFTEFKLLAKLASLLLTSLQDTYCSLLQSLQPTLFSAPVFKASLKDVL